MTPTIWIFSLEPIETRYTAQWHDYIPKFIKTNVGDKFNVIQINGVQKDSQLTVGAFLNFSDTNYWKSSQLCSFLEHHNKGETSTNDHIFFTDAWNPAVIQLKYMKELLGFNWTLHGMFHAGSYDPHDFLGRLIGNAPWVRHAEQSFFHAFDHNYFATKFHIELFCNNLLGLEFKTALQTYIQHDKIVRTGWPMEYIADTLRPFRGKQKRDLILFPHRIAPEKQVEIFKDLEKQLPQYEFIVCQEKQLTKDEYHTLLSEAKMVFSANLQETLGISMYEGAMLEAIPLVPDRLSYSEMYDPVFTYPSEWTESFESYTIFKDDLCNLITQHIEYYITRLPWLDRQKKALTEDFFSADVLLNRF